MSDRNFTLVAALFLTMIAIAFVVQMVNTSKELRGGIMPGIIRMGDEIEIKMYERVRSQNKRIDKIEQKMRSEFPSFLNSTF